MERTGDASPESMAESLAGSVAVRGSKAPSGDAAPGLLARQGALHLIGAVLDRGAMLDEAGMRGSPAERAEARGLADLTLRRLGQIDDALGRRTGGRGSSGLEPT